MPDPLARIALCCLLPVLVGPPVLVAEPAESARMGYIRDIPPESPEARAARHRRVAERRKRLIVMLHRGASGVAPENTLEAYAAAMDLGADGNEIDIHCTRDGVLYLMHDDTLDRTTSGHGKGREQTYCDLLEVRYKNGSGRMRVPTLAAFLVLARQRAMLIHLDVKQAGLQEDIEKLLDAADVWDHIVEINAGNAERLRHSPKARLLAYKGWFNDAGLGEKPYGAPAEEKFKKFLERPGWMIFVHTDPSDCIALLKREPPKPVPLPKEIQVPWMGSGPVTTHPSTQP